jgi:ribosomal protein S6
MYATHHYFLLRIYLLEKKLAKIDKQSQLLANTLRFIILVRQMQEAEKCNVVF